MSRRRIGAMNEMKTPKVCQECHKSDGDLYTYIHTGAIFHKECIDRCFGNMLRLNRMRGKYTLCTNQYFENIRHNLMQGGYPLGSVRDPKWGYRHKSA